jgi:hypothetical protein
MILFSLMLSTIASRAITISPNPQAIPDNKLITAFNKCIHNTIDQSYVFFFALFTYWLLTVAKKGDEEKATLLIFCFLLTRIFFTIGMHIHYFTKIGMVRIMGVAGNIFLISQLVLLISGKESFTALIS